MPLSAFALILLAGVIHASWNIAAKKANGDARFAFQSGAFMALLWAPVGLVLGWRVVPGWGLREWGFVALSGVLHVFYYVVLLRGYRKSDLTRSCSSASGSASRGSRASRAWCSASSSWRAGRGCGAASMIPRSGCACRKGCATDS